jgi:hypothetical protein
MAQPDLESFKKRGVMIAIEAVENVDQVPVAATNGFQLFEGQSGTEFDTVERPIDRPHFTNDPFSVANKRAFIEGNFELYPPTTPGAAAVAGDADCRVMLLPGGMTQVKNVGTKTTRFNPVSSGIVSATAYFHHVDTRKRVTGARNAISAVSMEIGQRFTARARLQGNYSNVTQEAMPTIITPTFIPAILEPENTAASLTVIGGVANLPLWAKGLSVDFGTTLGMKPYTSLRKNAISDRRGTFSIRIARTALSDFNPWTVRDAGSIITTKLRHLQADLRYSELGVRGQIEQINEVDIDGDYGWELSGRCIASSTGGDEFYIEFGDTAP